jgi:hypothetical protein
MWEKTDVGEAAHQIELREKLQLIFLGKFQIYWWRFFWAH